MKNKILYYIKEIIIFFLIMILLANIVSLYKSSDLNQKALTLTNINLIDGSKYKISSEKPTLVHIWATWCPICKLEASNIHTVSKYYNVLTIAVKSGSDNDIKTWLRKNKYSFKVINDKSSSIASNFNVKVFPTTLIYDKDKNLIFSDVGYTSTWGLMLRMWWAS